MNPIRWELVPHSNARTSWELLEDVIKAIEQEPRRIYMNSWNVAEVPDYTKAAYDLPDGLAPVGSRIRSDVERFPSCGTTGCISGWMNLLVAPSYEAVRFGWRGEAYSKDRLLPRTIRGNEIDELFYRHQEGSYPYPPDDFKQGSVEYAAWVVNNIANFMHKWEAQLRGHQIRRGV